MAQVECRSRNQPGRPGRLGDREQARKPLAYARAGRRGSQRLVREAAADNLSLATCVRRRLAIAAPPVGAGLGSGATPGRKPLRVIQFERRSPNQP